MEARGVGGIQIARFNSPYKRIVQRILFPISIKWCVEDGVAELYKQVLENLIIIVNI